MQTQQILGVSGGGMLFSAKNTSAKSSDTGFDQLIQMSQNTGAANEQAAKPVETKKETAVAVTKTEKPEEAADVSTEMKDTNAAAEKRPELEKTEAAEEATDVEAAERAAGILNQVMEAVKEVLGVSEEELNQFMEELGISNLNLLNPESLQNLVLMANSEQDAVVLLTDAELLSTVNELTAQVEQILQEAGVTAEDLMTALDNPEFDSLVEEALEQLKNAGEEKESGEEESGKVSTSVENGAAETTEAVKTVENNIGTEFQAEKRSSDSADKNQNQNDSTEVDSFTGNFVQNLQQTAGELSEVTGQQDMVQMIREIADQILEKVKVSVTAETTSLEIVLTPEELGKVNLTVSVEQDGMMKARFVTENELAKEAIERNLVQFKENLQEQGLKVDIIEVAVGNFEFDRNGQAGEGTQEEKKNSSRGFMTDEEISQKEETDQLARVFMEGGESTVNYMA